MKYLLTCILVLFFQNAFTQADSIPLKMARYALFKNADGLFVHTDKHIYTNNEYIWFSAWLLRCGTDSLPLHRFVSLTLVPADRHIPAKQQKFVMTNGYSYGSMQLPDTISPGEYKLVAYTNLMRADSLPVAVFTQDISIRSIRQPEFVAAATLLEDTTGKKDLFITVRNKITGKPVSDAELTLWRGSSRMVNARTDKDGVYRQPLQVFSADTTHSAIVMMKVKYNSDVDFLQNKWPWAAADRQLDVRCYPEGGYLVANVPCNIGWESKTDRGEPLAIRAVVFRDQHAVDTIRTDEHGLGKFLLVPQEGAVYSIRPLSWPAGITLRKDGYSLPAVLREGVTIGLPKAIAGDSLRFNVFATGLSTVQVMVHNFQKVFKQQELGLKPGGVRVLLLLDDVPKGLTAITLLDSNDRPLAERIFFAHYNSKATCAITPDKKLYEKRQPVTLSFQLTSDQQPAAGLASVACAQANRFDNSKHQDIESFYYLHSALQDAPVYHNAQGYTDPDYLEKVLLVRGWRRYAWRELMAAGHQPPIFYSPVIRGKVMAGFGRIKKPQLVTIINGNTTVPYVTTDSAGTFICTNEQLLVDQGKKLWMSSGDKALENKIKMDDPFIDVSKRLAKGMKFHSIDADTYLQFARDLALNDLNKVKQLAVVTITASRTSDRTVFGVGNVCGDYVCPFLILNCNKHFGDERNRAPVKGQTYRINGGGTMVYVGCAGEESTQHILQYDGIIMGKEFYKVDLSEATTDNPLYNSTIYWSPTLTFDKNGKAEANFNTSDLTGRFRIVVNGIAGENLFYATTVIEVK